MSEMVSKSGDASGDSVTARRVVELLWRRPDDVKRGPRPRVDVDALVAAGIEIADEQGLTALSIRAVADAVGLRPMGVYTYVPSKDALVALMVDAVAAEDRPLDVDAAVPDRLAAIADQFHFELLRHPWLLSVSAWRPVLGPRLSLRYERQLAALDGSGPRSGGAFADVELDRIIASLRAYATGSARVAIDARNAQRATGLSDAGWWQIYGPLLAEVMPEHDFPVSSRVGTTVGELYQAPGDSLGEYRFGLAKLIRGITAD